MTSDPSSSPAPAGQADRRESRSFRGRALSVSLTASDLANSLAWYRDVVGFVVDREHERDGEVVAVSLKGGNVRILLGQDDGAKGWDRAKGEGISMMITTAQDIDALAVGIEERGGTLETQPTDMPWGVRAFRVRDPDGFKIAISSERPE